MESPVDVLYSLMIAKEGLWTISTAPKTEEITLMNVVLPAPIFPYNANTRLPGYEASNFSAAGNRPGSLVTLSINSD